MPAKEEKAPTAWDNTTDADLKVIAEQIAQRCPVGTQTFTKRLREAVAGYPHSGTLCRQGRKTEVLLKGHKDFISFSI